MRGARSHPRYRRFYTPYYFIPVIGVPGARDKTTAIVLCLLGFLGFGGLHRLYVGKGVTGLVWFLTGGLCGLGTLVDLFLIGGMVDEYNGVWNAYEAEPDEDADASTAGADKVVIKETVKEIVKVKCQHCGTLNDHATGDCGGCGAPMG